MKNDRVLLCEWPGDPTDNYNDIPWPMVHEWAGYELIRWINQQNHTDCQLIVEKGADRGLVRLCAEFYNPNSRTEFALRFAK